MYLKFLFIFIDALLSSMLTYFFNRLIYNQLLVKLHNLL